MALIEDFGERVKTSSNALMLLFFKIVTGLFLGLTFGLIGQEIIQYGWVSLVLVMLVTTGVLLKFGKAWTWIHVLIFNLICVLIGLLLYMYILIAPG